MADSSQNTKRKKGDDTPNDQSITFLSRMVMLLLAGALIISVCINVYVITENTGLKSDNRDLTRRYLGTAELYQFAQGLVAELGSISDTNAQAASILRKHAPAIVALRLDSQARPFEPNE